MSNDNVNKTEVRTVEQAVELIPTFKKTKFTSSVDIDIVLNLKEKQMKESVRGSIELPHTFGSDKKVVVLCADTAKIADAKKVGAVAAGLDDVVEGLMEGKIEFDVVVATPDVMPKIVKLGKVLGPKGLMPNPKNGSVGEDVKKMVEAFKGGKISFKMEQGQATIRGKVGTVDMKSEELVANIMAYLKGVVNEARKLSASPLKKVILTTTMGSGIKLDINDIMSRI
ncbi:50S ribosomal protein L1 [Candidatus Dojkabacteria bacterium]|uniref:Ribosomal protein n=1 Tax=Candidatus Dojkabacteria bacterium TaxID=2099670 RepID=A0A955LBV5_9BACT|nr:50S ribosomal protein L1 [Candidatus Dojkabacteria bacterium]